MFKSATLKVYTKPRYIAHLHKVPYNRKYSVILPLNHIRQEGYIETVHFNCWGQSDNCQGITAYIQDFISLIHKADSDPYKYTVAQSLYWDQKIPGLAYSTHRKSVGDMPLTYWREYFESYEIKIAHDWIIESPYPEDINLPGYYERTDLPNGKINLKDRFALE